MKAVKKRIVLHFPGFEALDACAHHARYERSAQQTGKLWNIGIMVGSLQSAGHSNCFATYSRGSEWQTVSRVHVFDHSDLVAHLESRPLYKRLLSGFRSALSVVFQGGATAYFIHAWRFGLFFIFPFILVVLAIAISIGFTAYPYFFDMHPVHYILSIICAIAFFLHIFIPWSKNLYTLHLFSDWELAVSLASLDEDRLNRWLEDRMALVRKALAEEADEYVISSHSMGSSIAVHVIGMLLEREPQLFEGKRVIFVTLGGAILQVALLRRAVALRRRVGAIARAKGIVWFEVQCRTDAIHFYKSCVTKLTGHAEVVQPRIISIRIKHMLFPERYRNIRSDLLRIHRQYVLGADVRAPFDFILLTAGPLPAASFADFSCTNLPSL
ncbi:hypothetical protein ACFFJ7_06560 [Pseudochelatococcus lubricantis]|uniref:hypothetical protein n=1 Tax=Pseudochelatococcus lubricantis TaxID=1538102 RepID=UPI0035EBDE31